VLDAVSASDQPVRGVVRRLGEPVQFDPELLAQLKHAGVMPGARASFSAAGPYVLVEVDGVEGGLELPSEVAGHIFVGE
jgi:DtxR family Mn-dependent transcriptional regulator